MKYGNCDESVGEGLWMATWWRQLRDQKKHSGVQARDTQFQVFEQHEGGGAVFVKAVECTVS